MGLRSRRPAHCRKVPILLLSLIALLLIGAGLGLLGGLLGIGGGLFAIPVLGLFFGMDEQHAQGTSLAMVVPNVAVGLWNYAKRGGIDRKLAIMLAASALPMTIVAARVATLVPSTPLRHAFAIFTLCIAAFVGYRAVAPVRANAPARAWKAPRASAFGIGALGGALSGLFGVGGAIFAVPLMSWLFELSQSISQGYGLALVAPGTLAAIATYAVAGDVDWPRGIALAAGGIATVPLGVKLAYKMPERVLRGLFASLMVVSAVALLLR